MGTMCWRMMVAAVCGLPSVVAGAGERARGVSGFYGRGTLAEMQGWINLLPIDTVDLAAFETEFARPSNKSIQALARLVPGGIYAKGAHSTVLLPGWQASLRSVFQAEVLHRIASGVVRGVMLGDELCCGNSTCVTASLYPLASEVRQLIGPSPLIWTNECWSTVAGGKIPGIGPLQGKVPVALDFFGIDNYAGFLVGQDPRLEVNQTRGFAETQLYPRMHPHQRLMMVPGVFACSNLSYMPLAASSAAVVRKLEAYEEWYESDPRVAGSNPWHYSERSKAEHAPPCDMRLGASSMPGVLKKLQEMGSRIIGGGDTRTRL